MTLTKALMEAALKCLASKLSQPVQLIIGGGAAMLLAHKTSFATTDIDGVPKGIDILDLDPLIKQVALELGIAANWLNPYFSVFTHVLPTDYGSRLISVISVKNLEVLALSREDLLIMKCFAGRQKDISHAKALLKNLSYLEIVETRLEELGKRKIPGAEKAIEFFDDLFD